LRLANRRQESTCSWEVPAQSFMDLGTILVTTTARDTMLRATIGDHMDIGTTSVPTGGIDTGGIAAGTGIEMAYGSTLSSTLGLQQTPALLPASL
jgi:hypothetical protein